MSALEAIFTEKNIRKIWKKLRDSAVPVVNASDYSQVAQFREMLLSSFKTNSYMPSAGHGYLGFPKSHGCTRFVPILTKEDMAVFYIISLALQDALAHDLPNVFGGWQSVPKKIEESKQDFELFDPYLNETFSQQVWFQNWRSFNDLLRNTVIHQPSASYVVTSDVANFYDSVDVPSLMRHVRYQASDYEELVDLLEIFLSYWDRRIKGYKPSNKGIPQELIGDASRLLSHSFLRRFDADFTAYCEDRDLVYIRWVDDIIVFGPDPNQLELSMHVASKLMLRSGLNLNASKTKIYRKSEFKNFRALDFLEAIENKDTDAMTKELRRIEKRVVKQPVRMDTVFKGAISFMAYNAKARTKRNIDFLRAQASSYEQIATLNFSHHLKLFNLLGQDQKQFTKLAGLICSKPYAAPKAELAKTLWKYGSNYSKAGVSDAALRGAKRRMENASKDSEIIRTFSLPRIEI